jgi:hypothetical protein
MPALLAMMRLASPQARALGFDDVVARAKALSAKPYQPPPSIPEFPHDSATTSSVPSASMRRTACGVARTHASR